MPDITDFVLKRETNKICGILDANVIVTFN